MVQFRRRPGGISWLCLFLLMVPGHVVFVKAASGQDKASSTRRDLKRIQDIVDEFTSRLTVPQPVVAAVVPKNPLMVSVEFNDTDTGFVLSVEEEFLDELTDEELRAAIAHEIGHVWIFTHHPYLQTEALANQIAQRLVTRESIVLVYEKVWKRQGTKGDLARFVAD
jgi:hypothetical protein